MTRDPEQAVPGVLVHGSCVTRDALAFDDGRRFRLEDYYARSSLASAFADRRAPDPDPDLTAIESPFQRRMVERDLTKSFRRRLGRVRADAMVIDLADERFDLVVSDDGAVATRSQEYLGARPSTTPGEQVVESGSADFLVRWEAGWSGFVEAARGAQVLGRVVVHEAHWAWRRADGPTFDAVNVERANATLDYMYARMRRDLAERRFLRVPDRLVLGDPHHRWGASPLHYVPAYYQAFLDLLEASITARG